MTLDDIFDNNGLLKQRFPQYTPRQGQIEMAALIEKAIEKRIPAVIEGATGVGKGFAYLIPVILSGKKAIISTSNKSLQDQLDKKDLPTLEEVFQTKLSWTVLKGKNNYFCHDHFVTNQEEIRREFLLKKDFSIADVDLAIQQILKWIEEDPIGDVEYCPVELPYKVKEMLTCSNDTVHEKDSEGAKNCYAVRSRQRTQQSQIILVNHTLLALDINLREETEGKAGILPKADVIVIDEAHEFEKAAILAFSDEISLSSLLHLLNWSVVKKAVSAQQRTILVKTLQKVLEDYLPVKGDRYYQQLKVTHFEGLQGVIIGLNAVIRDISRIDISNEQISNKVKEIVKEAKNLQKRLQAMSLENENMLRWSEAKDNFKGEPIIKLKSVPLDISQMLKEGLFNQQLVICTSATLSVYNSFDFFRQQVGMPSDCYELIVPSPFNYQEQALVYVSDGENDKIKEISELLKLSKGRAFVLFTSYKDMQDAYRFVETEYPKMIQGEEGLTRVQLLEKFKSTPNAILFATKTFWEGVDIVGSKLSLVIIHKIPFENPSDLVFSSKCEKIDKKAGRTGVSFIKYAVPDACIRLKQGVGRLIRSSTDTGVIALLDSRVMFKGYGKVVLASLPPAYTTQKLEKVKAFFDKIDS